MNLELTTAAAQALAQACQIDPAQTEWLPRPIYRDLGHAPGAPMMVLCRVGVAPGRIWSFVFIAPTGATPGLFEHLAWWQASILEAAAGFAARAPVEFRAHDGPTP